LLFVVWGLLFGVWGLVLLPTAYFFPTFTRLNSNKILSNMHLQHLMAVDLGVKTGIAFFSSDGVLLWHKSQNFGNKVRLKRGIPYLLNTEDPVDFLVIEGGGPLVKIWDNILIKRNIEVLHIMADQWRQELLYGREQRTGKQAKEMAIRYARKVVEKMGLKKVATTNDDAAEAILIGLYAMQQLNWINDASTYFR